MKKITIGLVVIVLVWIGLYMYQNRDVVVEEVTTNADSDTSHVQQNNSVSQPVLPTAPAEYSEKQTIVSHSEASVSGRFVLARLGISIDASQLSSDLFLSYLPNVPNYESFEMPFFGEVSGCLGLYEKIYKADLTNPNDRITSESMKMSVQKGNAKDMGSYYILYTQSDAPCGETPNDAFNVKQRAVSDLLRAKVTTALQI